MPSHTHIYISESSSVLGEDLFSSGMAYAALQQVFIMQQLCGRASALGMPLRCHCCATICSGVGSKQSWRAAVACLRVFCARYVGPRQIADALEVAALGLGALNLCGQRGGEVAEQQRLPRDRHAQHAVEESPAQEG